MIRSSALLYLVSVAFAHPYFPSQYYDGSSSAPDQCESSQLYSQSLFQDEASSRPVRGIKYPIELENYQSIPKIAFIKLDENSVRTARSLVSDRSINPHGQYGGELDEQIFTRRIPEISNLYPGSPEIEQSLQSYKSLSYDSVPYSTKMDNFFVNALSSSRNTPSLTAFKSSEGTLNDYVKELVESNNQPVRSSVDPKQPHMFGFYYMNIQRYPTKQLPDDSAVDQKFDSNNREHLDRAQGQVNDEEILRYLDQNLQQLISKLVLHQKQEHSLFQELTMAQPQKKADTIVQVPNDEKLDLLGNEEKKFLTERLHQEEHWLDDSLKHVRSFLNELQADDGKSTSSDATTTVVGEMNNTYDAGGSGSSSTESNYLSSESTATPSVKTVSAEFSIISSDKETA